MTTKLANFRLLRVAAVLGLAATLLQGCGVYRYVFGGPDVHDLPVVSENHPASLTTGDLNPDEGAGPANKFAPHAEPTVQRVSPAETAPGEAPKPRYPTGWFHGELID